MATSSQKKRKEATPGQTSKIEKARKRIVNVSADFEGLKMLVYGKPKRGKTRFGVTGPKPIVIDCNDRGTLSIRRTPDCKVFRLDTWTDIDLIYWFLYRGDHDRQTVVIDTLTSLAKLCMKFILGDEASRDPTKDPGMPRRQDYGKLAELMGTEIIKFRNLPMHVIFLAQEKTTFVEEDDEGTPEVIPDLTGGVRSALTPAVDIIGRIYTKGVVKKVKIDGKSKRVPTLSYRMLIAAQDGYMTGDRSDVGLPRIIIDPSVSKIVKKIKEGI